MHVPECHSFKHMSRAFQTPASLSQLGPACLKQLAGGGMNAAQAGVAGSAWELEEQAHGGVAFAFVRAMALARRLVPSASDCHTANGGTGQQPRVANMVFDMYTGDIHVKTHGAVAQPRRGNHGLAAGCAFAKDILKAFMATLKTECPEGKPGDYAHNSTLSMERTTAAECAARMHAQLEKLNSALRRDNMALNDGGEQQSWV